MYLIHGAQLNDVRHLRAHLRAPVSQRLVVPPFRNVPVRGQVIY